MGKQLRTRILVILAVIAISIFCTFPPEKHINLGLDLKGGMHLILKVDTEELKEEAKKDAVVRAIEILRNRIDSLGGKETVIQRQGENEILVQLPGITDREAALQLIGTTAKLEFRLVHDNPAALKDAFDGKIPAGYSLMSLKEDQTPILIENEISLDGEMVADAFVDINTQGFNQPQISLKLKSEGAKTFGKLTKNNVGRRLAIILDDEVISAPNINEPIMGGNAQISGQFTFDEANVLALSLRSGALPAPMHIEEERTIGPLLGQDSIDAGITATTIAGILVLIFMLVFYMKAGIISNIALCINLLLIFGIMGFLNYTLPESQLTLTLPGIAGIILTLGMAVDANVLINERIREEITNGRPIKAAINSGFDKALKAIIDSNTTTLIAAFMLFQFGSGPIKGFAVTLTVGLAASLFTAIYVTRTLFYLFFEWGFLKSIPMMRLFSESKINFVSKRFICFGLSVLLIIGSAVTLMQKKKEAYGIDFVGGQIQEYQFEKIIEAETLRKVLKESGIEDVVIQRFEQNPKAVILRTSDYVVDPETGKTKDPSKRVIEAFKKNFPDNNFEILRIEGVGPVVGKALRKAAILAILCALSGILIFVGFRFKHWDFATAGVIALLHDVFVSLGLLVMFDRQVDLLVITALLTIAGYSINDTIIIYDRVRENLNKMKKEKLSTIINKSINQTLSRTLLTTITTLLVVVTLFLKGGEVLNTFALCLIIGFLLGTYSTIFIATPLVLAWEKKTKKA